MMNLTIEDAYVVFYTTFGTRLTDTALFVLLLIANF